MPSTRPFVVLLVLALLTAPLTPASAQESTRPPGEGPQALGRYRIGIGATPVDIAVDMSRALFDDGEADQVVIGRDDDFADSLAGAVLTGGTGPLLYVPGGPDGQLPQAVADEIARVLPAPGSCREEPDVFILGGTNAVSASVEEALVAMGRCTGRFAGDSRVETAVDIAEYTLSSFPTTRVLLARQDGWADAATGGAYSAFSGTPIVVTATGSLHPAVESFLAARSWNDIVLLGGTAALDGAVEAQAATHGPVRRVAGDSRDGTAAAIARQLWPRTDQVTAVNGFREDGWVYALAGAVPAAAMAAPQVYVQTDSVPPSTRSYVDEYGPMDLVVGIGATEVIADFVIESLGGGNGPVDDGQQPGGGPDDPPPPGDGGTIPTGTYTCYQDGVHFFENMDIVDAATYASQSGGTGSYTYDAGANDIQFTSGPYTWVHRGEYHASDFPNAGDGPTIVLYFHDDGGQEERILCFYADD